MCTSMTHTHEKYKFYEFLIKKSKKNQKVLLNHTGIADEIIK